MQLQKNTIVPTKDSNALKISYHKKPNPEL